MELGRRPSSWEAQERLPGMDPTGELGSVNKTGAQWLRAEALMLKAEWTARAETEEENVVG